MSTRRSNTGSRQHGLASDPVYVAAQGIQGTIATKKASILTDARARSLVFFIQALSLPELAGRPNPGGLKSWADRILKSYPDRVGTPSMHRLGTNAGQTYSAEQVRTVRDELRDLMPGVDEEFPVAGDTLVDIRTMRSRPVEGARSEYPASVFVEKCRRLAEQHLEVFLVDLCTDPREIIFASGGDVSAATVGPAVVLQNWPEGQADNARAASVPYFRDVVGALFDFQRQFETREVGEFAETTVAKSVFAALDAGLRLRRIVLVNGLEGIGKSEAARAWCAKHAGEVRFVDLDGITNKTSFFSSIARALGLPCSGGLSPSKIQSRIEAMLQRSGLMLVIDEAHYLWPQSERSEATPELVNWIDTALINRGVPVGLVTTPQFIVSMQRVERKTGWNSGQFQRRIKRVAQLPGRPTQEDLELVARRLLPKATSPILKLLVGFAGSQQCHHMDALSDAVKETVENARQAGRAVVTFADAEAAVTGVLSHTALAKKEIFSAKRQARRVEKSGPVSEALQESRNTVSAPARDTNFEGKPSRTFDREALAEV